MKKFLKSTWLYFIVPLAVTVIGGLILTKIENVNFLSGIWEFIKLLFNFIIHILTLKISFWIIMLLVIVLFIINKIMLMIKESEITTKKLYEDYTEDYYNGLKYRWTWRKSYDGIYIADIFPICECGCTFNYDMFDRDLQCPDCKKTYKNNVDTNSAERVFSNRYNKRVKEFLEKQNGK